MPIAEVVARPIYAIISKIPIIWFYTDVVLLSYAPSFQLVVRMVLITLLSSTDWGRILYAAVSTISFFVSISSSWMVRAAVPKLFPR